MGDDEGKRIGVLEVALGKTDVSLEAIKAELADIKAQLRSFLEGARGLSSVEGRVKALEIAVKEAAQKAELMAEILASLRAEHAFQTKQKNQGSSFWRERAGHILDAAIVAVAVWLMLLYRSH